MHYDPYNAKATSTSCPAIAVVGAATDRHLFLLDYYIGRGSYAKVYEKLFQFNDRWAPLLFTYEDVGHQNITEFHLKEIQNTKDFLEAKHRRFPRMMGCPTGGRSKEIRIMQGFFPHIENGKFSRRSIHTSFDSMLETFPNKTFDHDYDLLDALAQGSQVWRFPAADEIKAENKAREEDAEAALAKSYSVMVED
jgi:hypothetical protein